MMSVTEWFVLSVGVVTVSLLTTVYLYFQSSFLYWKKRNVPFVQPKFPFGNIGEMILFQKSLTTILKEQYDKLKGEKYGGIYFFHRPGFLIRDPDLIKLILIKDFSSFINRKPTENVNVDPLLEHLFVLRGMKWRNLRIKLTPIFTSEKLKIMFHTMLEFCYELQNILDESAKKDDIIEIKELLTRFATDVISSCAFGIQSNCLKNPDAEFRKWGKEFVVPTIRSAISRVMFAISPTLEAILRIPSIDPRITLEFQNMVKEIIEYREKFDIKRYDFTQQLIEIKNKENFDKVTRNEEFNNIHQVVIQNSTAVNKSDEKDSSLSMECLAAQAFIFFVAGFEMSSNITSYTLYELSLNPDIQDRARAEVDTVLDKHGGEITYKAIEEMTYLDKVVLETLRKYAPLPVISRECAKEYRIPGTDVVLEKGTDITIPVYAIHHDPKYYPDPDKYDPERFSEEEKTKRHRFAFLPFGEGPRHCIGKRFGMLQVKVGLVFLLRKYQFNVCSKTQIPIVMNVMNMATIPLGGIWLQIVNRPN